MGIGRKCVIYRRMLFRECGTCGREFATTADTPWVRQVPRDGKRQATTYYCSQTCHKASYKHNFDGKAWERRKQREATRDIPEKNRRYYQVHAEQKRERARRRYWADPEAARANVVYQRQKRKLLEANV